MHSDTHKNLLNYIRHLSDFILQEFDMIGLFGTQNACRSSSAFTNAATSPTTAAFKSKSKATNMLLDNQINEKLKEVNNNLIKKRPHFLKFFNENFFKPGMGSGVIDNNGSPENSCKR